ncbi:coactosin-like protein [Octodon degus]|uniref:Coactosin-like protein n=1 Tax=Octodon degus TaxID=10160 RepID=A0A6P6DLX7_OCTDE|nr:coactosin-like protein [Octodon degus]
MATKIDKEACREAYNRVRDDGSAVIWVTFRYEGATIVPGEQGSEYQHFIQQCTGRELRDSRGTPSELRTLRRARRSDPGLQASQLLPPCGH